MTVKKVINGVKENIAWIFISTMFMLIPFYYNTTSKLSYIEEKVEIVSDQSEKNEQTVHALNGNQLVTEERLKNIEKRLESIEKKIDYLIENDN